MDDQVEHFADTFDFDIIGKKAKKKKRKENEMKNIITTFGSS